MSVSGPSRKTHHYFSHMMCVYLMVSVVKKTPSWSGSASVLGASRHGEALFNVFRESSSENRSSPVASQIPNVGIVPKSASKVWGH